MSYGNEKMYGPIDRERNYGPETASMDPYTVQITRRLEENEKILAEILNRVHRLNEKLFGPTPLLTKADVSTLGGNVPVPKAMIEQIVGQVNVHNRRLNDLMEALNRLESL